MSGPANMNYDTLVSDVFSYTERKTSDTALSDQIPRLIMLAENRIATDANILGLKQVKTGALLANNPVVAKPAYWRRTVSFNFTDSTSSRTELLLRTYEFCRDYWPNPSIAGTSGTNGTIRYYADYNFDNFLVAATPNAAYPFELIYIARLEPLSSSSEINWLTANAPQLLLAATLLEAEIFLKNTSRIQSRQDQYDSSLKSFMAEDGARAMDRNIVMG